MMRGSPRAFDRNVRDFSMERAFAILEALKSKDMVERRRQASRMSEGPIFTDLKNNSKFYRIILPVR